ADTPSAKKSLGSRGSYFGCTANLWRQVRRQKQVKRQKAEGRSNATRLFLLPSAFCLLPLPGDISNLPRIERLQKIPCFVEIEFRIARLNHQEEFVARGLMESRNIEDRVQRHVPTFEGCLDGER